MGRKKKKKKVTNVIHGAAAATAAVGAGLAQAPGTDNAIIVPIQVGMIIEIGMIHGREVSQSQALGILRLSVPELQDALFLNCF